MSDLLRGLAPVSEAAWKHIQQEAQRTLKSMLAGRKLVDFCGPLGWQASAISLGRAEPVEAGFDDGRPSGGVQVRLRQVLPLVELRVPFELSREELEALGRGAKDPNLDAVRQAARHGALAEDRAIFQGYSAAGIRGLMEESSSSPLQLSEDFDKYPGVVVEAINKLHMAGVNGPYAIALGPRCWAGLNQGTENGYPIIGHVKRLLDGPIVSAPTLSGALVLSTRGGDFELTVGQDFSLGYLEHTAEKVRLYLQESFTFRVLSPEAAVPLEYPKK